MIIFRPDDVPRLDGRRQVRLRRVLDQRRQDVPMRLPGLPRRQRFRKRKKLPENLKRKKTFFQFRKKYFNKKLLTRNKVKAEPSFALISFEFS